MDIDGELYVTPIAAPADKTPQQISDELQAAVRGLRDGDSQFKRLRPARVTVSKSRMLRSLEVLAKTCA